MSATDHDISLRTEAVRRARADSLIEGLRALPADAAVLDAYARGEIDGDEVMRRLDANLRADEPSRASDAA